MLRALWGARYFIISLVRTEFQRKFIRNRLGALWMVINPLAQVALVACVLSAVMANKLPGVTNQHAYALYVMAGTLGWSLFAEIIQRSQMVFIDHRNTIKKLPFPRLALPMTVVTTAFINNVLLLLAMLVIFACLGAAPGWTILWLPVLAGLTVGLAGSCGLILGLFTVFLRDLEQVVPLCLQCLFWLTPVVYMPEIIPERYRGWLLLNPLTPLIKSYQDALVYHTAPSIVGIGCLVAVTSGLLALGLFVFQRGNAELTDVL